MRGKNTGNEAQWGQWVGAVDKAGNLILGSGAEITGLLADIFFWVV